MWKPREQNSGLGPADGINKDFNQSSGLTMNPEHPAVGEFAQRVQQAEQTIAGETELHEKKMQVAKQRMVAMTDMLHLISNRPELAAFIDFNGVQTWVVFPLNDGEKGAATAAQMVAANLSRPR